MIHEGSDPGSLSDIDLRDQIKRLELQIAASEARLLTSAEDTRRSRRLARGTFLTAGGFFGLTLDPLSAVLAVVGFFDWIESLRDDAAQMNQKIAVRQQLTALKAQITPLEAEIRRRIKEGDE